MIVIGERSIHFPESFGIESSDRQNLRSRVALWYFPIQPPQPWDSDTPRQGKVQGHLT